MKAKLLLISLAFGITFSSCDETDDVTSPTTTPTTTNDDPASSISFASADATLIAVKSKTKAGPVTITIGTAVGTFFDNGNLVDAGTVSVEGTDLTKNANHSYTATASATAPMGISFSIPINWSVSGANGFNSFTENINRDFPTVTAVNSGVTVDKSDGYTLSTSTITDSDSVLFTLGSATKIVSANTNSYTFTSSELSGVTNGTNLASIAPYNFSNKTVGGKNIFFVNESVVQLSVTVQD